MDNLTAMAAGRLLDQAEMTRRIYWMTPFSATQAVVAGRLSLKPIKIGRKNYYKPEEVDKLVEAYETLHGGCSIAHSDELKRLVVQMEHMTPTEAAAYAKNDRVVYLLAETALGKRWVEKHLTRID